MSLHSFPVVLLYEFNSLYLLFNLYLVRTATKYCKFVVVVLENLYRKVRGCYASLVRS